MLFESIEYQFLKNYKKQNQYTSKRKQRGIRNGGYTVDEVGTKKSPPSSYNEERPSQKPILF